MTLFSKEVKALVRQYVRKHSIESRGTNFTEEHINIIMDFLQQEIAKSLLDDRMYDWLFLEKQIRKFSNKKTYSNIKKSQEVRHFKVKSLKGP
jgi:hypothetical protein